jgi:glycosyltransferase involved in cell wall biosynthesis
VRWTALVEQTDHVCCRYRLAAFRPFLERAGHVLDLVALPRGWWARLRLFHRLRGANVILQRKLLPSWQLALLRRAARRLLFDFDDAVFLRDSYSAKGLHDPARLRRFAATIRACDAVVAGNAFLRDEAVRWTAPQRVHLIPTCVDPVRYPTATHERTGKGVQLVWIGSSSTLKGLEANVPLLEEIGQHIPGLCLKLVCDRFLELCHLPVMACPWTEEGEAGELVAADVGISWIPDDLWSRGKCGLKVLQFMAAGLPVVANPVGVHPAIIRHGATGFLAAKPGEWVEAISRLARDPELRARMGRAGRLRVEAEYGITVGAMRWQTMLDSLADRSARTA